MRCRVVGIDAESRLQRQLVFQRARKHVQRRQSRTSREISGSGLTDSFAAITSKVSDQRMVLRQDGARFGLVCIHGGIVAREYQKRLPIKAESDVLSGNIEHSVGI